MANTPQQPSPEAVKLMHRIRTYGQHMEFAVSDKEAALAIDCFAKSACAPLQQGIDNLNRMLGEKDAALSRAQDEKAAAVDAARRAAIEDGYDIAISTLRRGHAQDVGFPRRATDGADYLVEYRDRILSPKSTETTE